MPTSSSSTKDLLPDSFLRASIRRRWPLKVDKLAERLCSSPAYKYNYNWQDCAKLEHVVQSMTNVASLAATICCPCTAARGRCTFSVPTKMQDNHPTGHTDQHASLMYNLGPRMARSLSPISARTTSKQGGLAGAEAGIGSPLFAARTAKPSALNVAVLPPVLGPVMITDRVGDLTWKRKAVTVC